MRACLNDGISFDVATYRPNTPPSVSVMTDVVLFSFIAEQKYFFDLLVEETGVKCI